jgi:hypothetical protein
MKKLAYYQTIDGHKIFSGAVSEPAIDPAKTLEQVDLAAAALDVTKKIGEAREALLAESKKAVAAQKEAEIAQKNKDEAALEKATILFNRARQKMDEISKTLAALRAELESERDKLFYEKAVYFTKNKNAEMLDENAANALLKKHAEKPEHTAITIEGETIPDWRGTEYWTKSKKDGWKKSKIETVNVTLPGGAILDADLAAEQRGEIAEQEKEERLSALTPEEKARYRIAEIDNELAAIDRETSARSAREILLHYAQSAAIGGKAVETIESAEAKAKALRQERAEQVEAANAKT